MRTILAMTVVMFARGAMCQAAIEFSERPHQLVITADGQPLATYVYQDEQISRPYFAHVHAPGGVQVTRRHPPVEGQDLTDHATFHPGIWLAFGDLSGQDDWRLKAAVKHDRFVAKPAANGPQASFTVQNSYRRADDSDQVVCREICTYTLGLVADGYLLVSDSVFHSADGGFYFGDQEEMGLGVRVATAISVKSGGQIVDAQGRVNEKQIWGKSAEWCDYRGLIGDQRAGILLMPDPANFRAARFHARDYGLLVANPFGNKVFSAGDESRVPVAVNEPFRLRFGVVLHATAPERDFDCPAAYQAFLGTLGRLSRPDPAAGKLPPIGQSR